MADIINEATKIEMAKATAKVLSASMAGVPHEVQIEAALVLVKALFMAAVKPAHRISLFNSATQKIRNEIKEDLAKKVNK